MWQRLAGLARQLAERRQHREIWRAARRLSPRTLQREGSPTLTLGEDWLAADAESPRFLGYYSRQGLETALESYGLAAALRARGFEAPRVELFCEDRFTSTLRCFARRQGREHLLCETRCRFQSLRRPSWLDEGERALLAQAGPALRIEWMLLQNPCATFTERRPRLPGQEHPGLGLGMEVMEVLRVLGWRLRAAAFEINPLYVHNAVLYARQFSFVEPRDQAFLVALTRLGARRPLQDLALAVHNGFLRDSATEALVDWPAPTMSSPLVRPLARLYRSPRYAEAVDEALARCHLRIDWAAFDRARPSLIAALEERGP